MQLTISAVAQFAPTLNSGSSEGAEEQGGAGGVQGPPPQPRLYERVGDLQRSKSDKLVRPHPQRFLAIARWL